MGARWRGARDDGDADDARGMDVGARDDDGDADGDDARERDDG